MRRARLAAAALMLLAAPYGAPAEEAPGDYRGVDFSVAHPVAIAKIIAAEPQLHFVKSTVDDAACPAAAAACQEPAYLLPGDLVLIGKSHGDFSCVSYESPAARKAQWTNGWIETAGLTPVKPSTAPARADWLGNWAHAAGHLTIALAKHGRLAIRGEAFYAAAQNVHTGVVAATAEPAAGVLQFADDGSAAFDKASDDKGFCLVRMQRVEKFLVVEDNGSCGGVLVTFTGFYRRR